MRSAITQPKLLLVLLAAALAAPLASAAFYVEPRLAYLRPGGTPDIGDIGRQTGRDLPDVTVGLNLGLQLTPRLAAEFRFTHLGELTIDKESPNWNIFPVPPGNAILPTVRTYELVQETWLFSAALPIKVLDQDRFTLRFTPLLQVESSDIVINDVIRIVTAQPGALPQRIFVTKRDKTQLHAGAELSATWNLGPRTALTANYTYSPLDSYDAHLFGGGFRWSF